MTTAAEVLRGRFQTADALIPAASVTGVPLHVAAAFVDKESDGANIYGHDLGGTFSIAGTKAVTKTNYAEFYRLVVDQGRKSNGVGPMQITYRGYFPQARDQGVRLWVPFDNYRFGFAIIKRNLDRFATDPDQLAKVGTLYNAGNLTGGITAYGRDLAAKAATWQTRLVGATPPRTLQRGSRGDDVAAVQSGLMRRFPTYAGPIVTSGGADGSFGPATESVVQEFQRRVGLNPDGVVAAWTYGRLSEYGIPA